MRLRKVCAGAHACTCVHPPCVGASIRDGASRGILALAQHAPAKGGRARAPMGLPSEAPGG
eukprot:264969-Alexandrium_andersonii.AAC.1